MTVRIRSIIRLLPLLMIAALLAGAPSTAVCADSVGTVAALSGTVDIMRDGKLPAVTAKVGDQVSVGDFIRTKSNSRAEIRFSDGNVVKIAPRSRIDISEYAAAQDTRTIRLPRGKLEAVVVPPLSKQPQKLKRFEVHTPNAVAGVRGTDLFVFYDANATGIAVRDLSGGDDVYAYNLSRPGQVIDVPEKTFILIRDGLPPTPPRPAGESEFQAYQREVTPSGGAAAVAWNGLSEQFTTQLSRGGQNNFTPPPLSETTPGALNTPPVAPSIEVGLINMTGVGPGMPGLYDMQISANMSFLSSSAAVAPTIWKATSLSGTWTPLTAAPAFNPTGAAISISGNGPNGTGNASVTFNTWNAVTGTWNASVSGAGVIAGANTAFSGSATGTGASGATSGTFTGSGSGTVP